jgi:hypothetical protein
MSLSGMSFAITGDLSGRSELEELIPNSSRLIRFSFNLSIYHLNSCKIKRDKWDHE